MWQKPWGYKEGFTICGGLFLVGTLLQITLGKVNLDLLAYPVNLILGLVYVILLILAFTLSRKVYLFRWMGSYQAAVTSMIAVVVLTVIMGLTLQVNAKIHIHGIAGWFGFSQMLSAWSFTLLLTWFISLLGIVTLRRIRHFKGKDIPFLFNHLGLFLALTGAILGSADMQRLKMQTSIGKAEWRAYDEEQQLVELPLAVELQDFTIDEYPPKLMLIDNETGKVIPEGKAENILVEDSVSSGTLQDWQISIERRLPLAARVATEDTVKYVEFHSVGATYALYAKARNSRTGETREGWVSCGSFLFPYKAIRLNEEMSLVMPDREPRRFASRVVVYTPSGRRDSTTIEVNKPFQIEGWKIYQLSYDESKGKWSETSIFEIVRDPWLPVVYAGIWMMIAGAVCMFTIAGKRKEENA